VGGIFGEIFCGQWYYIHQLNIGPFGGLKFLVENSLKICVFFMFFNNKGKIIYVFKEKSNIKWKKNKFYSWALHFFSDFFCLVMSYEPQTWGPMADKKLHIIYVV
jgi:hypothetical protein